MKATVKNFIVDAEPMTRFEYLDKIKKMPIQHQTNKWIAGYYCNWNGFKFWLNEIDFNNLYTIQNDTEI